MNSGTHPLTAMTTAVPKTNTYSQSPSHAKGQDRKWLTKQRRSGKRPKGQKTTGFADLSLRDQLDTSRTLLADVLPPDAPLTLETLSLLYFEVDKLHRRSLRVIVINELLQDAESLLQATKIMDSSIQRLLPLLHDRLGNALEPRNDGAHPEQLLNDTTSAFQNAFYKQITSMWPHFTPTAAKLEEFLEDHARTLSVPEEFNITTNSQLHDQKPPQKITSAATHHAFALQ